MGEVAAARVDDGDTEIMRGLWKTFVKKRAGGSLKVRYHAGQWLSDRHCGAHWPTGAAAPIGRCPCVGHFGLLAAATLDKLRRKQADQPWWSPDSLVAYAASMIETVEQDLYRTSRVARGAIARTDKQFTQGKKLYLGLDGLLERSILVVYATLAGRLEFFPGWNIVHRHALTEVARDLGEEPEFIEPHFAGKREKVREHADTVGPRTELPCIHRSILPWWQGRVVHPLEEHATRPPDFEKLGPDGQPIDPENLSIEDLYEAVTGEAPPMLEAASSQNESQIAQLVTELARRLEHPTSPSRDEILAAVESCIVDGVIPEWLAQRVKWDEGLLDIIGDGLRASDEPDADIDDDTDEDDR